MQRSKTIKASGMVAICIALLFIFYFSFQYMRTADSKLLVGLIAILVGIFGIWALYFCLNNIVEALFNERQQKKILPYIFIAPAVIILFIFIVYPAIRTMGISFFQYTRASKGLGEFGFGNYINVFADPKFFIALRNNLLWLIITPFVSVWLGLIIAVVVDRIRWESFAKSLIFLPMAISFVGAAIIWRFVYYRAIFGSQIGILNALVVASGGEATGWLRLEPTNNLFLIIIMIWLQTGFAMVILSAAVKSVPSSLLEAARIDGAGEIRIFFRVIVPCVRGTILTVMTTVLITVLKVFDVVYVVTSGNYNTDVIANMMYNQMFKAGNYGRGSVLAVIIFIAVVPVMIRNIMHMREREV